jgi:glutathione S-transferase
VYLAPHSGTLFRNLVPSARDDAAVAAARAGLETGFGYLQHSVAAAPFAAGAQLSLADCTLLPSFAIMRMSVFPAFGLPDPTAGQGPLGRWWQAIEADATTGPFLNEYRAAAEAFIRMRMGK